MIQQRQLNVLPHGELIDQVEALENKTDIVLEDFSTPGFSVARNVFAKEIKSAIGWAVEHAENVQQGGLAAAGWTHYGNEFPAVYIDIDCV